MAGTVYGVFGDIGGCREGRAVLKILEERGIAVYNFVDAGDKAKADIVLEADFIPYEKRDPLAGDNPGAIVIGTSATAVDAQVKWTAFGKARGIPVIWVEDIWGTGEMPGVDSVSPDVLCVLDEYAATIARTVRPAIRIEVVGKPTFEALGKKYCTDLSEMVARVRRLILTESGQGEAFLLTFWAGGEKPEEVKKQFEALFPLRELSGGRPLVLVPRFHPKLSVKVRDYALGLVRENGQAVSEAQYINYDEIAMASSLNIGDYNSTSMLISAMFGVPAIMLLFPDNRAERLKLGYPIGEPPLRLAGACWGAESAAHFRETIRWIMANEDTARKRVWRDAASFRSLLEPGAAERAAAIVEEFL